MMLPDDNFDPPAILRVLTAHAVEFVIIGGIAGTLRGSDRITNDIDICYRRTKPNIRALVGALKELDAKLTNFPEGLPFTLDERSVWNGDAFTFDTPFGRFDCLANPSGTTGYPDIRRDATVENLGGFECFVCSLDDLIRMKTAAGRTKDKLDLEQLYALRRLIKNS
jgi:predicted nucleotidyltransferase